jgi:hypothetical protein
MNTRPDGVRSPSVRCGCDGIESACDDGSGFGEFREDLVGSRKQDDADERDGEDQKESVQFGSVCRGPK